MKGFLEKMLYFAFTKLRIFPGFLILVVVIVVVVLAAAALGSRLPVVRARLVEHHLGIAAFSLRTVAGLAPGLFTPC